MVKVSKIPSPSLHRSSAFRFIYTKTTWTHSEDEEAAEDLEICMDDVKMCHQCNLVIHRK